MLDTPDVERGPQEPMVPQPEGKIQGQSEEPGGVGTEGKGYLCSKNSHAHTVDIKSNGNGRGKARSDKILEPIIELFYYYKDQLHQIFMMPAVWRHRRRSGHATDSLICLFIS